MKLTGPRSAVIGFLQDEGEATPSEIARALGRRSGSTRELLRGMLADGLVVAKKGGFYGLPPDAQPDAKPDASDANPDAEESPIGKPKAGEIFAYSASEGRMIPNSVLRAR